MVLGLFLLNHSPFMHPKKDSGSFPLPDSLGTLLVDANQGPSPLKAVRV